MRVSRVWGLVGVACVTGCSWGAPREDVGPDLLVALGYAHDDRAPDGLCGVLVPLAEDRADASWWVVGLGAQPGVVGSDGAVVPMPGVGGVDAVLRARPLPDGDLMVLGVRGRVSRRAPDGTFRWRQALHAHHDLRVQDDGSIRVLTLGVATREGPEGPLRLPDDQVTVLGPDGQVRSSRSLSERYVGLVDAEHWSAAYRASWNGSLEGDVEVGARDLLHSNGLDIIHTARGACEVGDHLVMIRNLSLLACLGVDGVEHWRASGVAEGVVAPHDPRQLADGRISLFDNGPDRGWSRVVVVDPETGVWETAFGGPEVGLFSEVMGEALALEDGSWLINASTTRELWRVSPTGEVWWRWRACPSLGSGWIHHVQPAVGPLAPPVTPHGEEAAGRRG